MRRRERDTEQPRTDDQDVVELLHAVDLGQQLVDHRVVDARAARHAAALLADGVDLVEDDDVQAAVGAQLWRGGRRHTKRLQSIIGWIMTRIHQEVMGNAA